MSKGTASSSPGRTRARVRPQAAAVLVIPALALLLSGCLSSGYAYFSRRNPDNTELYFKLPSHWTTFDPKQVIEAANGKLTQSQVNQIEGTQWYVVFSDARHITLKQANIPGNHHLSGEAIARELAPNERDSLSLSSLRSTFLGVDPLTTSSEPINVLSYKEFTDPGGLRGSKMVVNVTQAGLVTTFGQVVVVDPQTNWLFALELGCRASCWGPNQGLINQIFNSWTVKELAK